MLRLLGHDRVLGLTQFLDLDAESNFPTWYQVTSLFAAAALLAWVARIRRRENDPSAPGWRILCGFFLFLSIDELVQLHENLLVLPAALLGRFGPEYEYSWIGAAILVLVALAAALGPWFRRLDPIRRRDLAVAGLVYFGGTVGFELLAALWSHWVGRHDAFYSVLVNGEEFLEMLGIALLIRHVLRELGQPPGASLVVDGPWRPL